MDLVVLQHWQAAGIALARDFEGRPGWHLMPGTAEDVARLLRESQEAGLRLALTERDAACLGLPLWLDVSRLNRVRQHPPGDFIVEVETGMTWLALGKRLALHKQTFPLHYLPDEPILDALAEDRPSLETGILGYPRDSVLKVEIATPDGQLTISGADVVKNVTGYDLNKLYVGGRHAFGVMTAVTLKLAALPRGLQGYRFELDGLPSAFQLARVLLDSGLPLRTCEIFNGPRVEESAGWQLYMELAGDAAQQAEGKTMLAALTNRNPKKLTARQSESLRSALQTWPRDSWVAEAALPLGAVEAFSKALSHSGPLQFRPAAGLAYMGLAAPPPDADEWVRRAQQAGGFLQWVYTPYYHPELIRRHNLPEDPVARALHQRLKTGYDPHGVLFTPLFPFDLPESGHAQASLPTTPS